MFCLKVSDKTVIVGNERIQYNSYYRLYVELIGRICKKLNAKKKLTEIGNLVSWKFIKLNQSKLITFGRYLEGLYDIITTAEKYCTKISTMERLFKWIGSFSMLVENECITRVNNALLGMMNKKKKYLLTPTCIIAHVLYVSNEIQPLVWNFISYLNNNQFYYICEQFCTYIKSVDENIDAKQTQQQLLQLRNGQEIESLPLLKKMKTIILPKMDSKLIHEIFNCIDIKKKNIDELFCHYY